MSQEENKNKDKKQAEVSNSSVKKESSADSPKKAVVNKPETVLKEAPEGVKEATANIKQETSVKATKELSQEKPSSSKEPITLQGLFAFKMSMTSLYDEKGSAVPVTALQYKPWKVSQIKTEEKESYSAVQVACSPQKNKRSSLALIKHLTPAGFKEGARYIQEIRQKIPEGIQVGQEVSINSLKKGDVVRITSRSKGRGFSGVIKRWGFSGGRASHGAKNHREPGSIGQHTEPARVFPGRKMPGRYGFRNTSYDAEIYDVLSEEQMILVKGSVPGARNTLVRLLKR